MSSPPVSPLGIAVLVIYLTVSIVIGRIAHRPRASSNDFLNASRSLPLWVVSASFLTANCGALEILGLSAVAAEYGAQAFQFYWIGAIPGMIFLALWMIPVYMRSRVYSVPHYLEVRYSRNVRLLNAYVSAFTLLMLCGISLYALAQVLHVIFGMSYAAGILLSSSVVLTYVLLGGVRATIYNEVLLLGLMLIGLVPLMAHAIPVVRSEMARPGSWHLWRHMPLASRSAPFDGIGVIFGLGFVLSFSYWGTDFVLMQRALSSRNEAEARQVPLWAGFGKLVFSLIVVVPGMAAARLIPHMGTLHRYDQALPLMMQAFYGPTMLGFGFTALAASLMSGLAANVSAFAAIWTEDIYRPRLRPGKTERHYLQVSYLAYIAAIAFGALASSLSFAFGNLMDQVQLLFSLFSAPFWAIFLFGMASRKATGKGALAGFLSGSIFAILDHLCILWGWIHYGSVMNADFHVAIAAFVITAAVTWAVSKRDHSQSAAHGSPLVFEWRAAWRCEQGPFLFLLAAALLLCCIVLNVVWR